MELNLFCQRKSQLDNKSLVVDHTPAHEQNAGILAKALSNCRYTELIQTWCLINLV